MKNNITFVLIEKSPPTNSCLTKLFQQSKNNQLQVYYIHLKFVPFINISIQEEKKY